MFLRLYVSFRIVAECNFLAQAHSIAVYRGHDDVIDSVVVLFRHAAVSVLQYDAQANQMKTVFQHCCAAELELKASSSFVPRFCRVQGNVLATQFTSSTLSLIQLGAEVSSFTVPVKRWVSHSSGVGLASLDDACFLPTKAGSISLAVLGKTEPHAWIGRTSTISGNCSAVRMLSVDFSTKSVSVNWSFESLPSGAVDLVPLPAPRGGLVVVSPDTVSFCEEFSSSVTFGVNRSASTTVHFLRSQDGVGEIDLIGSRQMALTDGLIIFATTQKNEGEIYACHLVRQDGTFSSVSALVWERLSVASTTVPSSLSLSVNRDKLLITSALGDSLLFRISGTEILLPMSVFSSAAEEAQLAELESAASTAASPSTEEFGDLVRMYQDEVHKGKIAVSIELGLLDELDGTGPIVAVSCAKNQDGMMISTKSGAVASVYSEIPTESIFEIALKKMVSVFSFSLKSIGPFRHRLAMASSAQFMLIDCSNGLKEIARTGAISGILEIVPMLTEDGHLYLITSEGIVTVTVHVTTSSSTDLLCANILEEFQSVPVHQAFTVKNAAAAFVGCCYESGRIEILGLSASTPAIDQRYEIILNSVKIESFSLSISPTMSDCFACVSDSTGSIFIYRNGDAIFKTSHASLCKPVLINENDNNDDVEGITASLSVTDASKRPLEVNPSTALFASKVKIVQAKLVWLEQQQSADSNSSPLLILLVEGRPALIYTQFGLDRFSLVPFDIPVCLGPLETTPVVTETTISGHHGVWISMSISSSVFLTRNIRGQLFLHPVGIGAISLSSGFTSEFIIESATLVLESQNLGVLMRIFKFENGIDLFSKFPQHRSVLDDSMNRNGNDSEEMEKKSARKCGMLLARSVAGTAVNIVSEEPDPGLIVALPPPNQEMADDMIMMMHQNHQQQQYQEDGMSTPPPPSAVVVPPGGSNSDSSSLVLTTCPMPPNRQKHEIRIYSSSTLTTSTSMSNNSFETVSAIIACQPNEMVTGMTWADSILGLGSDVLIIGTTLLLGEESPAQGRLVVIRVDYAPGLAATAVSSSGDESSSVTGGKVLYDSVKRSAITVVKDWKGCLAVGLGHRLMMYQWDSVAGRLRGVGMIDLGLQISSFTFFKSFIVASDILRGVYLLRYKEDPVMDMQGRVVSMAASVQQIAKSASIKSFSVTLVDTIRMGGSVGIVSIDVFGNLDLEVFSPVHFGQFLRQSVPFKLPAGSVATAQVGGSARKSIVIGTASGSLCQLIPVSEAEHHMAQTLNGLMIALLPQLGGVNPRLFHVGVGREAAPNVAQSIESVDLLVHFLYLATPLQAEIASRMKQPIEVLMRAVSTWIRPVF